MKRIFTGLMIFCLVLGLVAGPAYAGWFDSVKSILGGDKKETTDKTATDTSEKESSSTSSSTTSQSPGVTEQVEGLSVLEMDGGIKDALVQAVQVSITQLGRENGFMDNNLVRIAMPEKMAQVEQILRKLGQGKLADQFIESMNRAAEQAVPKTTKIFGDAIKGMSIQEAAEIVGGSDNAATEYFDKTTRASLEKELLPVVHQATDTAQVTYYYKLMMDKAQSKVPFLKAYTPDLDQYVTDKALDGLFIVMAQEETKIRKDPVARGTDLLKKVFGGLAGSLGN